MYVVQGTKGYQDDAIDEENPAKSIKSKMWMMPTLEDRDKQLVVPRLARAYNKAINEERKNAVAENLVLLPKIYEALVRMDQFAFTFSMQSQLAADLVMDPEFSASEVQLNALREGKLFAHEVMQSHHEILIRNFHSTSRSRPWTANSLSRILATCWGDDCKHGY